jgi:excinuclease UvrABC nuclease subunit
MTAGEVLTEDGQASLVEQRRALPDQPGVYLFRDATGRVI